MTTQIIGFANKFYTLWDYTEEVQYVTDAYGNHHKGRTIHRFFYIKNISIDLDKVKSLYPNLSIDEQLRGKTSSFSYDEKIDLPENYFWKGKYKGMLIDEILQSDFQYCLWFAENCYCPYLKNHEIYTSYFLNLEKEKNEKISSKNPLKVGDVISLICKTNGFNYDEESGTCLVESTHNDNKVIFEAQAKPVYGMYPYIMIYVDGKPKRVKGKEIKVKVSEVLRTDLSPSGNLCQLIKI